MPQRRDVPQPQGDRRSAPGSVRRPADRTFRQERRHTTLQRGARCTRRLPVGRTGQDREPGIGEWLPVPGKLGAGTKNRFFHRPAREPRTGPPLCKRQDSTQHVLLHRGIFGLCPLRRSRAGRFGRQLGKGGTTGGREYRTQLRRTGAAPRDRARRVRVPARHGRPLRPDRPRPARLRQTPQGPRQRPARLQATQYASFPAD